MACRDDCAGRRRDGLGDDRRAALEQPNPDRRDRAKPTPGMGTCACSKIALPARRATPSSIRLSPESAERNRPFLPPAGSPPPAGGPPARYRRASLQPLEGVQEEVGPGRSAIELFDWVVLDSNEQFYQSPEQLRWVNDRALQAGYRVVQSERGIVVLARPANSKNAHIPGAVGSQAISVTENVALLSPAWVMERGRVQRARFPGQKTWEVFHNCTFRENGRRPFRVSKLILQ